MQTERKHENIEFGDWNMNDVKALTPRQAAKRRAILDTVRTHLNDVGYDGLSMRKIAEEARVSPSTLYEIYESKDSLVLSAIRESLAQFQETETTCEPGLDHLIMRLEQVANGLNGRAEVVSQLLLKSDANTAVTDLLLNGAVEARRNVLVEMKQYKQVDDKIDIALYSRILVYATWGTTLLLVKGVLSPQDFRRELIRASISPLLGVATRKSKRKMLEILDA